MIGGVVPTHGHHNDGLGIEVHRRVDGDAPASVPLPVIALSGPLPVWKTLATA